MAVCACVGGGEGIYYIFCCLARARVSSGNALHDARVCVCVCVCEEREAKILSE